MSQSELENEGEIEEEEIKPAKQIKRAAKTTWNNRSEEDFEKKKVFDGYDGLSTAALAKIQNNEVKLFLRKIDVSKVPIQKSVTRTFRVRAPDYDAASGKRPIKEWLYWEENWNEGPDHFAKDYKGEIIGPVIAHVEGKYEETLVREQIETIGSSYDEEGMPIPEEQMRRRFTGLRPRYYIPFTKKTVEDVIKNSAHSDQYNIKFILKVSPDDFTVGGLNLRREITYDMFVNWTFDELFKWITTAQKDKPVDYSRSSIMEKTGNSLAFTPS